MSHLRLGIASAEYTLDVIGLDRRLLIEDRHMVVEAFSRLILKVSGKLDDELSPYEWELYNLLSVYEEKYNLSYGEKVFILSERITNESRHIIKD